MHGFRCLKIVAVLVMALPSSYLNADMLARYQLQRVDISSPTAVSAAAADQREWLVWKYGNRVQLQQQGAAYSVVWIRMKNGSLERKEVYPSFKTVVSYEPGDAAALGLADSWEGSAALFDGAILKSLEKKSSNQLGGYEGMLYEGTLHGRRYRVLWQPAKKLPAVIHIRSARSEERISLIESFDSAKDGGYIQPDTGDTYDDLDYADIGDNETHPLVQALHRTGRHSPYYPNH